MGACVGMYGVRVVVAVEMRAGGMVVDIHVGHASNQIEIKYSIYAHQTSANAHV